MIEHDMHVGELLKLLDDLGIAENTIVQYSTDNGPHYDTWPDAGTMPFRSEENSNWEGPTACCASSAGGARHSR
jgi:arylsulfatase